MDEVLWTDPSKIRFKISPHSDLSSKADGDWDLERRHPLDDAVKHRSIAQRYVQCWPWEETDLFKQVYTPRIAREGIRGCRTMRELLSQYYDRVDGMFEEMKASGFKVIGLGGRRYPLPRLLVGRDGEVFIGNQGNHRLAMAKILGLSEIAGEVVCRHSQSALTA